MTSSKIQIVKSLNACVLCVIVIALSSFTKVHANDGPSPPTISVTGNAEVLAVPDKAVLTFSIGSRDADLSAAVKDNDDRIKAAITFLKESKIEAEDIRTEVITIRPVFEQSQNIWKGPSAQLPNSLGSSNAAPRIATTPRNKMAKVIGYTARRSLSVTIKDLKSFEDVYGGLIGKGVNDVSGVEFRTTELRKHRDAARLQAVKAAREKAEAMAGELGATLSSVQSITEYSTPPRSTFSQNSLTPVRAFEGSNSSVAAGVIEIKANVHVVFRLGNTELKTKNGE